MRSALVLVPVMVLLASGCSSLSSTSLCTAVGATEGVDLTIPAELFVPTGTVSFQVCDDGDCASATKELEQLPKEGPAGRDSGVTYEDLGRTFDDGMVQVSVRLRGPGGELVATREQDVELTRAYPNGKACDGDGFVGGRLSLQPGDAL